MGEDGRGEERRGEEKIEDEELNFVRYVLQIHNLPKKFKVKAVRALAPIVGEVAERKRVYELSTGVKKEDEEGMNITNPKKCYEYDIIQNRKEKDLMQVYRGGV